MNRIPGGRKRRQHGFREGVMSRPHHAIQKYSIKKTGRFTAEDTRSRRQKLPAPKSRCPEVYMPYDPDPANVCRGITATQKLQGFPLSQK
jgi:hypothetical protein